MENPTKMDDGKRWPHFRKPQITFARLQMIFPPLISRFAAVAYRFRQGFRTVLLDGCTSPSFYWLVAPGSQNVFWHPIQLVPLWTSISFAGLSFACRDSLRFSGLNRTNSKLSQHQPTTITTNQLPTWGDYINPLSAGSYVERAVEPPIICLRS